MSNAVILTEILTGCYNSSERGLTHKVWRHLWSHGVGLAGQVGATSGTECVLWAVFDFTSISVLTTGQRIEHNLKVRNMLPQCWENHGRAATPWPPF